MSAQELTQVQAPVGAIPTVADMLKELAELKAQNEALKAASKGKVSIPGTTTEKGSFILGEGCYCKVSEKGAVSIYGFGRFPITVYKEQLFKLAKIMSLVLKFAKDNDAKLAVKPVKETAPVAIAAK